MEQPPGGPRRRLAADDDRAASRRSWRPQPLAEPAGHRPPERVGQLPRREVEQRDDDRQARRDRQRAAPDRVIDGAGRAAAVRPPGGAERRAAQQERVDGHRAGPQQPRRRQLAPADDLEVRDTASVGSSRSDAEQERERLAGERVRVEGAEQTRRGRPPPAAPGPAPGAAGRRGRPGRRAAGRAARVTQAPGGARRSRPGHGPRDVAAARPSSSSARSWTTTTSASTTIRRLIFDWPTRRSRNVIGTSRIRAPRAVRPEGHLDLEDVAAGVDAVERDRRQGRRPPGLEAAGQVVLARGRGRPGRTGCRRARRPAGRSPSRRPPPPVGVARADDEVGRVRRRSGR